MKRSILYICALLLISSCAIATSDEPYGADALHELAIKVIYPDDYNYYDLEGMTVSIKDVDYSNSYSSTIDSQGESSVKLTNGRYILQFSSKHNDKLFNATADNVIISDEDLSVDLTAIMSTTAAIIIKEIYCGGCMKSPEEGTYQFDKYVILHNNSSEVAYLDGLCFGMLSPYNSTSNNIWSADQYADYVVLADAVWKFGGDGTSFPLQAGEDVVVCQNGAIDHAAVYPLSVNLNKEDYFVLYSPTLFTNTSYHPAPGDKISTDRYLSVVQKFGQANAWAFSVNSPAPVIFRPIDTTIEEHLALEGSINSSEKVAFIPVEWVYDGVEVYNGESSANSKRFTAVVDAGYVTQSTTYSGASLHRYIDQEESERYGYEILMDANNSTADFYQLSEASLHE